ncbi:hypothetical protein XI09_01015 [Bradyrhizobium sp. CCBAU 11386]|uniref:hypothetical protein n=1 Tax=Bradyrhizobium sp. CCBAU 11386 TaxID=1630837 RepID=UPI0023032E48|nr:hypothetical protein [Bradyrhizobium sp. CCBAU 11386]MDA9503443.1 hypothetical protein [Bradyrhizobium sp. CCBAU 11386]
MIAPLVLLALLLATCLSFLITETLPAAAVASVILATAASALAALQPTSTFTRLARLLRPLLIIALITPALWMALQLVPIPFGGLGNPIWATASAALNEPLAERFTVDLRATMLSLAQYNAIVATALVTAVVALDRQRAARVLYALVCVTTLVSALAIWRTISPSHDSSPSAYAAAVTNGSIAAALGVILSTAMAIRAFDQLRRPGRSPRSAKGPIASLLAAILSLIVSIATVLVCSDSAMVAAALLGAGTLAAVVAIRRWFFGFWGMAGAVATAAIIFIASFTVIPIKKNTDLTLALSTQSEAATERMLQDIGPVGSGAGTFDALLPVYRDIGVTAVRERPTVAAAIAIEMGHAFLCGLLIVTVVGACTLFKRSLSRGYDYLFPAVGAGASVSLLILAFAKDGILNLSVSLLVAALYGLAFGQSLALQEFPEAVTGKHSLGWRGYSAAFRNNWARIALVSVGVVLIAQAAWLTSHWWPFGAGFSTVAATVSRDGLTDKVSRAASIAPGHEDVGATRRFTAAAQAMTDELEVQAGQNASRLSPTNALANALHCSPLRGDVWLMLAAIAKQDKSAGYNAAALLKMSYYTAPNDVDLFPLRLSIALGTDAAIREPELRDLVRRDLKVAIARQPAFKPAIVAAYQSASPEGRSLIEKLVSEFDPSYLQNTRARDP